jgi:bifunctional non-homologous end joining protein LigD
LNDLGVPLVSTYGFDLLALDGEDLRPQPLDRRRARLARILARSTDVIVLSEHLDGDLGPVMYRHACRMGLEGIVSKRRDRPYLAGRSTTCLKIKNPASAAVRRIEEGTR